MITFEEIESRIINGNEWGLFDVNPAKFGGITRISNGIRLALTDGGEKIQLPPAKVVRLTDDYFNNLPNDGESLLCELAKVGQKFYNGDFGTMYGYDEKPIHGREWGEYETTFGRVMVHREQDKAGCYVVVCFLPFER